MQSMCDARRAIGAANGRYIYRSAHDVTGYAGDGFDTAHRCRWTRLHPN